MGLQAVFSWFVEAILVWVIAGFAGWKFIDGIREQKIGKAIFTFDWWSSLLLCKKSRTGLASNRNDCS